MPMCDVIGSRTMPIRYQSETAIPARYIEKIAGGEMQIHLVGLSGQRIGPAQLPESHHYKRDNRSNQHANQKQCENILHVLSTHVPLGLKVSLWLPRR